MSEFDSASYPVPSTESSTSRSTLNNVSTGAQNAKNAVVDSATNAYNAAANHPMTQNVKNTVANGPVAENVKDQVVKTSNEFSNLANARQTPSTKAKTGQPLTQYHSLFSSLFSWENPRASAIAYAAVVLFIFGARYLDLLRYAFKMTWMVLGATVLAEIAGQTVFGAGFVSQVRPRKYYVLPKETLDSMTGDLDELINFFIIESQRLLFAENVFASAVAFISAFISYYLVKIVPFWGLSLIATSVLFLTPLIYKQNKEAIDAQIEHASRILNQQTNQVKQIATHHASAAAATTKQYVGDYSAKAQEMIGNRGRSVSPTLNKSPVSPTLDKEPLSHPTVGAAAIETEKPEGEYALKEADFPVAPKQDILGQGAQDVPTVGSSVNELREDGPLLG